jgi:hypothetical protein
MKRKRTPSWFAVIAMPLVVAAAVFLPRWFRDLGERIPAKVRQMHVLGTKALSSIQIQALTGVQDGTPLFGGWQKEALEKVKKHPRIERVAVVRDVTGKVVVAVSEWKAAALVNLERLYFIDREGRVLEATDAGSPEVANLVVLTGPWKEKDAPSLKGRLSEGLALRDAMVKAGFGEEKISELHFDRALGWVVYRTGSKTPAVIGIGRFEEKAKRLARVLQDWKGKEGVVREIDLDFRDRAIVKVKG